MRILGLHNASDSGVCLIEDGKLLEAVSEERLNRVKLYTGWPQESFSYVLRKYGLKLTDIDVFAYAWHGEKNNYPELIRRLTHRVATEVAREPRAGLVIEERVAQEVQRDGDRRRAFDAQMHALGIDPAKIRYYDHHQAHAWSAFACSPFDDALAFTLDGRGDHRSGIVADTSARQGVHELDYLVAATDGLGFLYGQITHYLGYKPHRHEGKVTGLAARGDAKKTLPIFERLVVWDENAIRCRIWPYKPFYTNLEPELIAQLDCHSSEDIAAGLQVHCEQIVARWVAHWIAASGRERDICLAGGIFANVRINQVVAELPGVRSTFIFPHMGDGGLTLGAAAMALHELTGQAKIVMPSVQLGPEFGDKAIAAEVGRYAGRVVARPVADKARATIDALCAEKVVGFVEGRMEFGPRALGARTVLYHTRDRSVNDWLNKRMRRTEFMPFAPVTPEALAVQGYIGWKPEHTCAHFMTRTYHCTEPYKAVHKAVVHIDGTARPQIVNARNNGRYFDAVSGYCERTGELALINTSFNMHEEPIVCSPRDAFESLCRGMVDVVMIGDIEVTAMAAPLSITSPKARLGDQTVRDSVFVCDGGVGIGGGHVMRCLALAQAMHTTGKWRAHLVGCIEPQLLQVFDDGVTEGVLARSDEATAPDVVKKIGGIDALVIDNYGWEKSREIEWRAAASRTLVIDDLANRAHDCDILLDVTPGRTNEYASLVPADCIVLTGPQYALLHPNFARLRRDALGRRRAEAPQNIVVNFGFYDGEDMTTRVLSGVGQLDRAFKVDVILGSTSPNAARLVDMARERRFAPNLDVRMHLDVTNVAKLLAAADLAVGACGSVSWERCCLGLPAVTCTIADNQRDNAAALKRAEAVVHLGVSEAVTDRQFADAIARLCANPSEMVALSHNAAAMCDGLGANRVALAINPERASGGALVYLRPAQNSDCRTIFDWQCHENTRRYARNSKSPTWEDHQAWFSKCLVDPDRSLNIVVHEGVPSGVARFDRRAEHDGGYEVSILVAPDKYRRGIAGAALRAGRQLLSEDDLFAFILPENAASLALFASAGYVVRQPNLYVSVAPAAEAALE